MHASALTCLALALTTNAFPFARQSTNTTTTTGTIQRRSTDYNVVNVGSMPEPEAPAPAPQPISSATTTVLKTVTAPGAPPATVTVTVSPSPTLSATPSPSNPLWATSALPSSSPSLPVAVPTPAVDAESVPSAGTAMDRLARAFGRSIDSHLFARSTANFTTGAMTREAKRSNETAAYAGSGLAARGFNGTEGAAYFPRSVYNSTEYGTAGLRARGYNGTAFRA